MYQTFYNLTGKPFRLSPDPAFFFPSRGHKRALAYLRYGLNQDEGFVVITGAPGTGKTTLAKILLQEMGESNIVVAHLTTTQLEADDMLRMVAASFGLRYEGLDKTGLLKSLESFLLARARERKKALLVIDEAQNLPARSLEELRMLSNLQVGDRSLLQIFLLGQEQFRQMLDEVALEQLKQRIIANYHLSPLGPDESQRYIESRLQQVNWNNDPSFAEIAYEQIHEYTGGVPRRINMLCDRIMLFGCMEEIHAITAEVVQLVTRELDEEVSGKVSDDDVELGAELRQKAQPRRKQVEKSSTQLSSSTKSPRPVKQVATVSSNAHLTEEDDLDIDYAAFSSDDDMDTSVKTKKRTAQSTKIKSRQNKANQDASKSKSNADRRAEKLRLKTNKPVDNDDSDKHVMGNTVQKRQPADHGEAAHGPVEYSDRDLFRVIPGGKPGQTINQPGNRIAAQAKSNGSPSNEDVKLRRILRLVLAFHRSPSRFPGLDNPEQPLPEGITELLELAISDDEVLNKVSPAAVMGISPVMLRAAVRFFVRRALFIVNGDHYRILGVQPNAPQALIEKHYDLLMRLLRQDKQRGSAESVTRVGQAYEALSRVDNRAIPKKEPEPAVSEDEEMVIDFDSLDAQQDVASGLGAKPNELFNPQLGISRKRMRYASQAAVLGFGALVVILGLYIVQLEPGEDTEAPAQQAMVDQKVAIPPKAEPNAESKLATIAITEDPERRSLQLSDGSMDSLRDDNSVQFSQEEIAAIRKELLSAAGNDSVNKTDSVATADTETLREPAKAQTDTDVVAQREVIPASESSSPRVAQASRSSESDQQPASQKSEREESEEKQKPKQEPAETAQAETTSDNQLARAPRSGRSADRPRSSFSEVASRSAASSRIMQNMSAQERANAASRLQQQQRANSSAAATKPVESIAPVESTGSTENTETRPPAQQLAKLQPPSQFAAVQIKEDELLDVVGGLITGYESGDLDKLMTHFDDAARTNNRINAKGIRTDYQELFSASSSRKLHISGLNWKIDGDNARAEGDYIAQINPISSRNGQSFKGNITIQVQKDSESVKITRLYFTNQSVSTSARLPEQGQAQAAAPAPAIQQGDLQNMLNNFVTAYAEGDLDRLMTLFANNAQTNDQNTLAGIRSDHDQLFKGTSLRQISIKSVKWTMKDSNATGEGWFQVKLQPTGSTQINTVKGRIRISAKNTQNGAQITKMFHAMEQ